MKGVVTMSYKVMDVAQFMINYSVDNNQTITNLKLQKLLYYVQAAFLVEKDEPCFEESIVNWRHGPVVSDVYNEFKNYASSGIDYLGQYTTVEVTKDFKLKTKINSYDENPIRECDGNIIKKVLKAYKDVDPWEMVDRTHQEDPWRLESDRNEEITKESIKKYFSNLDNKKRIYCE